MRYSYEDDLPYYLVTGGRATLAMQAFGQFELRVLGGRESMAYRGDRTGTDAARQRPS